jgi:hypothetical protein
LNTTPFFKVSGTGDAMFADILDYVAIMQKLGVEMQVWENPYDRFYNTIARINEQLRERERLEKSYQRLLENENNTIGDVKGNIEERLVSLYKEKGL